MGKPELVLYQQNFSLTLYQKIQALSGYLPENQEIHKSWSVTNKSKSLWHCLVIYQKIKKELTYLFVAVAVPGSSPGFNLCELYQAVSWPPDVRF